MRLRIINFLKIHPFFVNTAWACARLALTVWGWFLPVKDKTVLFASFGGRKFDDSPKAIYDELCKRPEFADWTLIWAFVDPEKHDIPRGEKVKIDTPAFFRALLTSRVWVSNSGMDRGIKLKRKGVLRVETWHGSVFKKGLGEENQNTIGGKKTAKHRGPKDSKTIRIAQNHIDLQHFPRLFHAEEYCFLRCGLPRNDALLQATQADIAAARAALRIPDGKQAILYMPTYREYAMNERDEVYCAPPMDLEKWERLLGDRYVLLFRAHYAVSAALDLRENDFVRDVSKYPAVNDLYLAADIMVSDYSSSYIDYALLERPMFCFAYDLEEFNEKRGFFVEPEGFLPCSLDKTEDVLLEHILTMDWEEMCQKTKAFRQKNAAYVTDGGAKTVVDELTRQIYGGT